MIKAGVHLYGSMRGYRTLARSSDVTDREDGLLSGLGFGQISDPAALARLDAHPTAVGRALEGDRFAITRALPGRTDDAGRPTLALCTLLFTRRDYLSFVRFHLDSILQEAGLWDPDRLAAGMAVTIRLPLAHVRPATSNDIRVADAWSATGSGTTVISVLPPGWESSILALPQALGNEDAWRYRWGVRLLSVDAEADVATTMGSISPGRRGMVRYDPFAPHKNEWLSFVAHHGCNEVPLRLDRAVAKGEKAPAADDSRVRTDCNLATQRLLPSVAAGLAAVAVITTIIVLAGPGSGRPGSAAIEQPAARDPGVGAEEPVYSEGRDVTDSERLAVAGVQGDERAGDGISGIGSEVGEPTAGTAVRSQAESVESITSQDDDAKSGEWSLRGRAVPGVAAAVPESPYGELEDVVTPAADPADAKRPVSQDGADQESEGKRDGLRAKWLDPATSESEFEAMCREDLASLRGVIGLLNDEVGRRLNELDNGTLQGKVQRRAELAGRPLSDVRRFANRIHTCSDRIRQTMAREREVPGIWDNLGEVSRRAVWLESAATAVAEAARVVRRIAELEAELAKRVHKDDRFEGRSGPEQSSAESASRRWDRVAEQLKEVGDSYRKREKKLRQ